MSILKAGKTDFLLKTFKIAGQDIDISVVESLNIYEGLDVPGNTGIVKLYDEHDLLAKHKVFVGDKVQLSWSTEDSRTITRSFTIYSIGDIDFVERGVGLHVTLYFCDSWLIDAFGIQVQHHWENKKVSDIVRDLITKASGKPGKIIPTKQKLETFVSPLWTPMHTIRHLMSFAMTGGKEGGYTIWTNLATEQVNFMPISKIRFGSPERKVYIKSQGINFQGKIYHAYLEQETNLFSLLNMGLPKQDIIAFIYDRYKCCRLKDDVHSVNYSHLSPKAPVSGQYLTDKYKNMYTVTLHPNHKTRLGGMGPLKELVQGFQQTAYVDLFADSVKLNVALNGNTDREVGQVLQIDVPKVDKFKTQADETLSGNYIIRNIRHVFEGHNYYNIVTLVADGPKNNSKAASW